MKDIFVGPVRLQSDQISVPIDCSVAILASRPAAIEAQLADAFPGLGRIVSSGRLVSANMVLDNRTDIPAELTEPLLRLSPEHPVALVRHDTGEVFSHDPQGAVRVRDLGRIPPFAGKGSIGNDATVPAGLEEAFLAGLKTETGQGESLYAVIDAAACPGLPERLASSGLRHNNLFKGEAAESLADVSPYLVEFSGHESFLRRLFSTRRTEADWINLYDLDACLFLRSTADFDSIRSHFRRYTKFRDETGRWMFLRFWSSHFRAYLCSTDLRALPRGFLSPFSAVLCRLQQDRWQMATLRPDRAVPPDGFTQEFRWFCRTRIRLRFLAKVRDHLQETHGQTPGQERLALFYLRARTRGYRSERAVARYMETLWLNERRGWNETDLLALDAARATHTLSDTHRAGELLKLVRSEGERHV